jgi:hypothetical protein
VARCSVCGRLPSDDHSVKVHFVHDHMGWLDGTSVYGGKLIFRPAPWRYDLEIARWLIEAIYGLRAIALGCRNPIMISSCR